MVADDENWREWAMTALTIASGYWGGAGFILVPFNTKTSRPAAEFADIVRAYDPDHVVSLNLPTASSRAGIRGSIGRGGGLSEADRQLMVARNHGHDHLRESGVARDEVVSWCSPMRSVRFRDDHPTRQTETVKTLRAHDVTDTRFHRGFAPAPPMATEGSRLAASALWRSDIGLMAAMRVGVAQTEGGPGGQRAEPTLDDLGWLIRPVDDAPRIPCRWFEHPDAAFGWASALVPCRPAADPGVKLVHRAPGGGRSWQYGHRLRACPRLRPPHGNRHLAPSCPPRRRDRVPSHGTASVVDGDIRPRKQRSAYGADLELRARPVRRRSGPEDYRSTVSSRNSSRPGSTRRDTPVGPAIVDGGYLEYVVNEHVGVSVPIPVTIAKADGTTGGLSGLESPTPSDLIHPLGSGWVPYWYIEVIRIGDKTPRARDLPPTPS